MVNSFDDPVKLESDSFALLKVKGNQPWREFDLIGRFLLFQVPDARVDLILETTKLIQMIQAFRKPSPLQEQLRLRQPGESEGFQGHYFHPEGNGIRPGRFPIGSQPTYPYEQ